MYLADQVSRARSGFDPSVLAAVKAGTVPPSQLPNVLSASHQVAWTVFRFGPSYNVPFPDGQFPVEAVDELYKQMIPDLNALLPNPNPTWKNMAALAVRLRGAILMGHSESGFFPEQAAPPALVRASVRLPASGRSSAHPRASGRWRAPAGARRASAWSSRAPRCLRSVRGRPRRPARPGCGRAARRARASLVPGSRRPCCRASHAGSPSRAPSARSPPLRCPRARFARVA